MDYICGNTEITQNTNSVVVLGNFDGVHLGHQKLFNAAIDISNKYNLKSIAFSFYPHPTKIIGSYTKKLLMSYL